METASLGPHDALIAVDVQNDFCPRGALPVAEGDRTVPILNDWIESAARGGATVVASRDWHPAHHISFHGRGGLWPAHCIQGSEGANFHPDLRLPPNCLVVDKGTDPDRDNYSPFAGSGLADELRRRQVSRVWIGGLALDVCVRAAVLDALQAGFETHLLAEAARPVDPGNAQEAIRQMADAGAVIEGKENHG